MFRFASTAMVSTLRRRRLRSAAFNIYAFVHFLSFALAGNVTLGSVGAVPTHPPGPVLGNVRVAFNTSAVMHLLH
eukprot:1030512-Pyramimonas_sp.AAC.1